VQCKGGIDIKEMCVTVMKELKPNKIQIETLEQAVKAMGDGMQSLKSGIQEITKIQNDTDPDSLLFTLGDVITWQATINGNDGWKWFPNNWKVMYDKLCSIQKKLQNIRSSLDTQAIVRVVRQCATCIQAMDHYKTTCENIPGKEVDSVEALTKYQGFFSWMGLHTNLDQLKALAS